jgi:hypothetical protein
MLSLPFSWLNILHTRKEVSHGISCCCILDTLLVQSGCNMTKGEEGAHGAECC